MKKKGRSIKMTETINGKTILTTPISREDVCALRAGDVIFINGDIVTGRDDVHIRVVDEGMALPVDLEGMALLHAGPIIAGSSDEGYKMIAIGPTTSMRMEKFEYDFIEKTGVRLIIGKGGMGKRTAEACLRSGAIHCVFPAGNAVLAAVCVEEIVGVDWLDLGMPEALWHMRVKELGPLIVSIDTEGRNLFEERKKEYNRRKEEQIKALGKKLRPFI